ncbi:hypothetical protein ACWEVP_37960 [Amycolatopsis sp. NPDC003865]
MAGDTWAAPAGRFADDAYASVKGRVRTYVLPPPAAGAPATSPSRRPRRGNGRAPSA